MTEPAQPAKPRSRRLTTLVVLLLLAGFAYFAWQIVSYDPHYVTEANDATLFKLRNDQMVEPIGVAQDFSPALRAQARQLAQDLLLHKRVRLELDQLKESPEHRVLAYVFVNTPQGEVFFNELLIRKGLARSLPAAPNLKCRDKLDAAEEAARREGVGIWARKPN